MGNRLTWQAIESVEMQLERDDATCPEVKPYGQRAIEKGYKRRRQQGQGRGAGQENITAGDKAEGVVLQLSTPLVYMPEVNQYSIFYPSIEAADVEL